MKVYRFLTITLFALIMAACSSDPEEQQPVPPEPTPDTPEVKITQISFLKEHNPSLDRNFSFTPDNNGHFSGRIYAYKLNNGKTNQFPVDIRNLVATYETTAAKIFIDDKLQTNSVTKQDYSKALKIKAQSAEGHSRSYTIELTHFTEIPIVFINTDSGKDVASKNNYEGATIEIYGCNGMPSLDLQAMEIHGRGNSSWSTFTKKPSYTLKLAEKAKVLGMPKHKKWVMISNYRDKTLLRNNVAWWLSSKLSGAIKWTPRYQHVELILNGTHRGVYQLVEQVRIDNDRVDINEMEPTDTAPDAITGGYIIELDRGSDSDQWGWAMPYMKGSSHRANIKKPKKDESNQAQHDYIKAWLFNVDKLLGTSNDMTEVMTKYIDMPSWAAQWLVFELSGTPEPSGPNSWYTYKDKGDDKWYCGPPWDFDYKSYLPSTASKWVNKDAIYMPFMLKYPPFKAEILKQWAILEPLLEDLIDYIEEQREYMRLSASANWAMHEQNLIDDNRRENGDEFILSDEAIDRMIEYLRAKWQFVKNNIESL